MSDSKLDSALKLAKNGFRIFPLSPNSKIPLKGFTDFSKNATTDEKTIRSWWTKNPEANIAISTDEFLVVDVDMKNMKNGVATMEKLSREGKDFPPTTQQTTTTGGAHLFYKTPYPVKNSASKLGPGLDVRGMGGYVVASGSIINGKKYTIDIRNIPNAPNWLIEASVEARPEAIRAHEKIPVNEERAKDRAFEYLKKLPPCEAGERNVSAFKVAAKLKDFGLSVEDTFVLMMEDWKCEPALELEELEHVVKSAYTYGRSPQGSDSPEAFFPPTDEIKKSDDNNPIHRLEAVNEEYALVLIEGKHRILYETTDEEGKFKIELLVEDTFHKIMKKKPKFQPDGCAPIPLSQAWMGFADQREYKGLVFSPEQKVDPKFYNLWRGFSVEALKDNEEPTETMKRGVALWEEHLLENICSGDPEHFKWIYEWFAHIIQKPWEKPGTCLVLRGGKGVGKNALFESVGRLFKDNYLVASDKDQVFGRFNSHMEKLLLMVLDEATWGGDKRDEGKLKSLITDPNILIEHKGVNIFKMKSRLRLAVLSNEDWVVPATEDERRYAVFNVGVKRRGDKEFFGEMERCLNLGADRYLLTKLKNYDISEADIRTPPETEGLNDQKMQGLRPLESWWFDCLSHGYIDGIDHSGLVEIWETEIEWKQFVNVAMNKIREIRGKATHLTGAKILNEIKRFLPQAVLEKNREAEYNVIKIPSLQECRDTWDRLKKFKNNWTV